MYITMKRINFEILLRKLRRKEYVYIAEIQKLDDSYTVVSYTGAVDSADLPVTFNGVFQYENEAEERMLELLNEKFNEGYRPVPNGSEIHVPGFKNAEYNRTLHIPKVVEHKEHRRLNI